ncbi:Huntingtin [Manis pentadactyla]|nr:Huntingtin [Manis pentadactyla]
MIMGKHQHSSHGAGSGARQRDISVAVTQIHYLCTWKVLHLHSVVFKWKLYETNLDKPASVTSYPRILFPGPASTRLAHAGDPLEDVIVYPLLCMSTPQLLGCQ